MLARIPAHGRVLMSHVDVRRRTAHAQAMFGRCLRRVLLQCSPCITSIARGSPHSLRMGFKIDKYVMPCSVHDCTTRRRGVCIGTSRLRRGAANELPAQVMRDSSKPDNTGSDAILRPRADPALAPSLIASPRWSSGRWWYRAAGSILVGDKAGGPYNTGSRRVARVS